jgi:hypothetical protein
MKTLLEIARDVVPLPRQQKIELIKLVADMLNKDDFADMVLAAQSSTEFWNNATDDEVWNHV